MARRAGRWRFGLFAVDRARQALYIIYPCRERLASRRRGRVHAHKTRHKRKAVRRARRQTRRTLTALPPNPHRYLGQVFCRTVYSIRSFKQYCPIAKRRTHDARAARSNSIISRGKISNDYYQFLNSKAYDEYNLEFSFKHNVDNAQNKTIYFDFRGIKGQMSIGKISLYEKINGQFGSI